MVRGVESPKQLKVADCETKDVSFTATLPPGHGYELLLGVPRSNDLPSTLHIRIEVSGAYSFKSGFELSSHDLIKANWLHDRSDLQGYILGFHLANSVLNGKKTYTVTAHFSESLPHGSSLWLCWLHNMRD